MIYVGEDPDDPIEGVWLLLHVILSVDGVPVTLTQNRGKDGEDTRGLSFPVQAVKRKDLTAWMAA